MALVSSDANDPSISQSVFTIMEKAPTNPKASPYLMTIATYKRQRPIFMSTYCGLTPVKHSVLNVKALVGIGAFSVIVKTD